MYATSRPGKGGPLDLLAGKGLNAAFLFLSFAVIPIGIYLASYAHWFGGPTALSIPVPLLLLVMFLLVDEPEQAKWLTPAQKAAVRADLAADRVGKGEAPAHRGGILSARWGQAQTRARRTSQAPRRRPTGITIRDACSSVPQISAHGTITASR